MVESVHPAGSVSPLLHQAVAPRPGSGGARLAVLVFVGYYAGARLGLGLTFMPMPISVLWPPNAIVLGALLVVPTSAWWIVLAAALPAHLLSELPNGIPLPMALSWFGSNLSESLLGAYAVRRLLRGAHPFGSLGAMVVFVGAVCTAALASSFLDSALVRLNAFGATPFWELVRRRSLSNMTASLVVAPLIVAWGTGGWPVLHRLRRAELHEAILLAAGLAAAAFLAFNVSSAWIAPCATLPFLLWAAMRFGTRGASAAFAAIAIAAIWGTGHGVGALASPSPLEATQSVQVFLLCVGSALLCLAAASEERQRHQDSLADVRDRLAHASRLSAMGELSASIAHEINQPMSAILANIDTADALLAKGDLGEAKLRSILHDIRDDDLRAVEIVRHMRNLARKRAPESRDFDVAEEVRTALRLVAPLARHRRVALGCRSDGPLPVHGDAVHVQQTLMNLVLNAMDALEKMSASGRLVSVHVGADAGMARICVRDTGPGIPAAILPRVFEPFFTTKSDGSGLGLSIARTLVEAQGGSIWAENGADGGAAVTFTIPLSAREGSAP